jgi:hypothetical protein
VFRNEAAADKTVRENLLAAMNAGRLLPVHGSLRTRIMT